MKSKLKSKMKKKIRTKLTWFEVIMDNNERKMILASSILVASNLADELYGDNWKYIATVN